MKTVKGFMRPQFPLLLTCFVLISLSAALAAGKAQGGAALPEQDVAAIRTAIEAYRTAWLSGGEEAVLKTLTDDAVLIPPHGGPPVVGRAAMKKFWWPADGAPSKVTKLTIAIDEIGGSGVVAYARGQDEVAWSSEQKARPSPTRTAATISTS